MTRLGFLNGIVIWYETLPKERRQYSTTNLFNWPNEKIIFLIGIEYDRFNFKTNIENISHVYGKKQFIFEDDIKKIFISGCLTSFDSKGHCSIYISTMTTEFKQRQFKLTEFL